MNLGLKTRYFSPNPHKEPDAVFVRKDKFKSVVNEVHLLLETDRKPKIFVTADYGSGKTTLLRFVEAQSQKMAVVAYAECPPMNRRSGFEKILGAILRALTRETVFGLLHQAHQSFSSSMTKASRRTASKAPTFAEITGFDSDLADFIGRCLELGNDMVAWRFLSGEKLSMYEVRDAKAPRQIIELDQVISFINGLAKLCQEYEKKPLLLLLDEFERTRPLMGEAKILFKEALRALVDDSCEAGVVIAASVTATEELPGVIEDDAVSRRLSPYQMAPYSAEELLLLAKEIIRYRRDETTPPGAEMTKTQENVAPETYPFTREGLESAVETIRRVRGEGRMRPADLLDVMDRALLIALEGNCPVIDSKIVAQACDAVKKVLWKV